MSLLIDADMVVFAAGFAAERAKYTLHIPGLDPIVFYKKKDLNAYVKEHSILEYHVEKERILEPLENALGNVKHMLSDIVNRFPSEEYKIYLSGKDNFREHVDSEYKANRDPTHRPHWEPEIREYMKRYWNAEQVDGMEADDAIGIQAWKEWNNQERRPGRHSREGAVIASLDKDLMMIPGEHYNWGKKEIEHVGTFEAEGNYYRQLVMGDRSDNIPGIYGIGPAKVDNAVWGDGESSPAENIAELYTKEFGDGAKERFNKNRLLLWICRTEQDVPRVEDIQGIINGSTAFKRTSEPEVPWQSRETEPESTQEWHPQNMYDMLRGTASREPVLPVPGNGATLIQTPLTTGGIVDQLLGSLP